MLAGLTKRMHVVCTNKFLSWRLFAFLKHVYTYGKCHFTRNCPLKVSKGAKIRNRYNQVPHPTQDTNGKVTNSQLDTTNESQEVSPFPAGDHKAHINRRAQRHSRHKTEQKHKRSTKETTALERSVNILLEGLNRFIGANLTHNSDVDQDK